MYRLGAVLVLAAVLALAACGAQRPVTPAPAPAPPTRTVPPPTLSPNTTLVSSPPRLLRKVDHYFMFEVNAEQYELIGRRVAEVLHHQHLWDQGVRFGMNFEPEKHFYFVLIDPGLSHLTARQILDRLLGII